MFYCSNKSVGAETDHYGLTMVGTTRVGAETDHYGLTKDGVEAVYYMLGGVNQVRANTWGMGSLFPLSTLPPFSLF